jgi:hypothetical protein
VIQLTIDHEIGRRLAEEGMAQSLRGENDAWLDTALDALRRFAAMPAWAEFKIEDFRAWYLEQKLPPPHDHHVWGGLSSRACRARLIAFTGKYAPSVSPKTHGHPVKVWRSA